MTFTYLTFKQIYKSKFIFKPLFCGRIVSYKSIFDFNKNQQQQKVRRRLKMYAGKDRYDSAFYPRYI